MGFAIQVEFGLLRNSWEIFGGLLSFVLLGTRTFQGSRQALRGLKKFGDFGLGFRGISADEGLRIEGWRAGKGVSGVQGWVGQGLPSFRP